jgi:hypothetical protein
MGAITTTQTTRDSRAHPPVQNCGHKEIVKKKKNSKWGCNEFWDSFSLPRRSMMAAVMIGLTLTFSKKTTEIGN